MEAEPGNGPGQPVWLAVPRSAWSLNFFRFLLLGLALIPLVILILEVSRYAVDIPFWDQWNFVPLLGKAFEGSLNFSDLWQQHNEHRLVFPRLLMLGLARLSGYNILFELITNIVLATGILILVTWQFFRTTRALGLNAYPWVVPVLSLLGYSLNQGENWVWGWQLQIFLNVAAVVVGCILLSFESRKLSWSRLGGAMLAGVVAVHSFANGLLFWLLGLAALLILPGRTRKLKWMAAAVWSLATAGIFLSYFCRFRFDSPSGKPWSYLIAHPAEYFRYVLQYLGAAIINYEDYALVFGLIGVLFFAAMSVLLWCRGKEEFRPLIPFVLFGLYALGCAVLTGIGRLGFGPVQAMSYRYVTFSSLLWMANFVYLFLLLRLIRKRVEKRLARLLSQAVVLAFIFLLLIGIGRTSYRVGHRVFASYHDRLAPVRLELYRNPMPSDELLLRLYIDAACVRGGLETLKKHRLSVFRMR